MAQHKLGAEWLNRQLALKGKSQEETAKAARVSNNVLTKIKAGGTVRTDVAVKLVNYFNSLPDIEGMAEALAS